MASDESSAVIGRREGLLSAAAAGALLLSGGVAVPAAGAAEGGMRQVLIAPENLNSFQKAGQRKQMLNRSIVALKKVLTPEDAPAAVRLVFNDAATYDVATGAGGVNGSIVLPEELGRPENASLKPLVEKLAIAKQEIDAGAAAVGQSPISWADLLVVAGKVASELAWVDVKVKRATLESGGKVIAEQFKNEFTVQLGRIDATTPDTGRAVPAADAPVPEIMAFMATLGQKPFDGPSFAKPKAPFWERPAFVMCTAIAIDPTAEEERWAAAAPEFAALKKKYELSRNTVTRTDFEVDFVDYYNRLANMGAKFDSKAYLYPLPIEVPNRL